MKDPVFCFSSINLLRFQKSPGPPFQGNRNRPDTEKQKEKPSSDPEPSPTVLDYILQAEENCTDLSTDGYENYGIFPFGVPSFLPTGLKSLRSLLITNTSAVLIRKSEKTVHF
jgi:hypothetical protein